MRCMKNRVYSSYVPWYLLAWLFLPAIGVIVYYLTRTMTITDSLRPGHTAYITGVISLFYGLTLALLCLEGLYLPRRGHRALLQDFRQSWQSISPLLLSASLLCFTLSQLAWLILVITVHRLPVYPSPEHFIQLSMYPCLVGAILFLPGRNLSLLSRLRIFLDSLIIMAAVATLCYYFVLAPLLINGHGTLLAKTVSGLYLSGDLLLMFCLLLASLRSGERFLLPVLTMLGLAIFILFFIHIMHTYELLYKNYNQFSLANAGLPLVGTLFVGAAQTLSNIQRKGFAREPLATDPADATYFMTRWKALLPSFLVLVFSLLVFLIWLSADKEAFPGQMTIVYAGGFVVLALMILRQFLALYQIGVLQRQLSTRNRSLSLVNAQLETLATTDPLTGLSDHRKLIEKLDEALADARLTGGVCGIIFLDIDHFKAINDHYGHQVGDEMLNRVGRLVQDCLRKTDCVGRWGGEEFLAILPQSDAIEVLNTAECMRATVDRRFSTGNQVVHVTCSLGVAVYPSDASERDDLILCADKAMYVAKRLGRNAVRSAHEPLVQAMTLSEQEASSIDITHMSGVVEPLLALLEARDRYTAQHMRRVGALSLKLALLLGMSEEDAYVVSLGGLLHDLGKLATPDAVLLKKDRLDEEEFDHVTQHPQAGAEILAPVPGLQTVAAIVRAHHEWMNGSGYPDGLQGAEIPLGARIVSVVDAYDAMTTTRTYQAARPTFEALREIQKGAGSQFDPRVIEALTHLLSLASSTTIAEVA